MTYSDHIYPFAPTGRNGRPRNGSSLLPVGIIHDTESSSAMSTIRYLDSLNGPKQRAAGYHSLADETGWYHIMDPLEWVAWHAGVGKSNPAYPGANDCLSVSGGYFKDKPGSSRSWKLLSQEARDKIQTNIAKAFLDLEEHCGLQIERVYSGDLGKGKAYLADKRAETVHGFYGHGDVAPHRRSDPGWSAKDWDRFLHLLADTEMLSKATPTPEWAVSAVDWSITEGITTRTADTFGAGEAMTRAEVVTMLHRYDLKQQKDK